MASLSRDIDAWVISVQPTQHDFNERKNLITLLQQLCANNWDRQGAHLELFGSSRTGLLLPGSDVDVVIIDNYPNSPVTKSMELLTRKLQRSNMFKSVYFIRAAKVPIIKVQSKSDMTADISCNVRDGLDGSQFIMTNMAQLPPFRPVFLVVKRLLAWYELNDAASGGLGSFALSVMMITYMKTKGKQKNQDLGSQLLAFLEYYSSVFDSDKQAVIYHSATGVGPRKSQFSKADVVVENPNKENHNVAGACRKWLGVRALFTAALRALQNHNPTQFRAPPPHTVERGDFAPFPFLAVLNNLSKESVPDRVITKVKGKASDKTVQAEKDVITIEDEENYDTVSHTVTKKRKRDREEESDDDVVEITNKKKEQKTKEEKKKKEESSSEESSEEESSEEESEEEEEEEEEEEKDTKKRKTDQKEKEKEKAKENEKKKETEKEKVKANKENEMKEIEKKKETEKEKAKVKDTTDNNKDNDKPPTSKTKDDNDTNKNNKNNKTKKEKKEDDKQESMPIQPGFIAPIPLSSNQVAALIRPYRKRPPQDLRLCSVCEKEVNEFENHLISYSHVKAARSAGIFC